MLDLVRLSPRDIFPPGGVDLYRHIALLTELSPGDEVLDVACGNGVPLEYWVQEYGVHGSGVDADADAVGRAEARAREQGLSGSLQFQEASPEELPYRDEIFDVVVGEMGMTGQADPEAAIRELARVARPGASVVLIQLVWKAPVDVRRRRVLSSHLGVRPLMLVELKRLLREAGVRNLHTEDWSDEETAFRRQVTKPFPDFAELFGLGEKLGILRRAFGRWGWRGVKTAIFREREVHRLLTKERIIGLDLILGTRGAPAEMASARPRRTERERAPLPDGGPGGDGAGPDAEEEAERQETGGPSRDRREGKEASGTDAAGEEDREDSVEHEETAGLPLFGGDGGEDG